MTLHKDSGLQQLLPELNKITQASLWYADESALPLIKAINLNPLLTLVSNRYDVYCCALENNLQAVFTDFTANDYPNHTIDKIIYRVSKEKALTHFLLNQSAQLLSPTGELIISGNKQDGIKSYGSKLNTQLKAQGKLKKQGDAYLGRYTSLNSAQLLNDQHYATLQKIDLSGNTRSFYSKPGVFGWNKIDKGTQLLLKALEQCYPTLSPQPAFALDLGCGYGWIFLNIDHYNFASITATDNNAGALLSAQKNASLIKTPVTIKAGDCGNTITDKYHLVLCNPPFHQGFQHNQQLTEKFVRSCHSRLQKEGYGLFVINEFIGIEKIAKGFFKEQYTLIQEQGFKVILFKK